MTFDIKRSVRVALGELMGWQMRAPLQTGERYGEWILVNQAPGLSRVVVRCVSCGDERYIGRIYLECPDVYPKTNTCQRCVDAEKEVVRTAKIAARRLEPSVRLKRIWRGMISRCFNPDDKDYANYGGRGIKVWPSWFDPEHFIGWSLANGYESELSIDRIDNDSHYAPHNCRWATAKQQAANRRRRTAIRAECASCNLI